MPAPAISVLVATYNRAHFLPQCLASLYAQSIQPLEIIVVDDGSTDATPELLLAQGDRIHSIRKENGGKSSALQLALKAAQGEYIYILDDDDVALPNALENLVAPLAGDRGLGMSFGTFREAHSRPDGTLALPGTQRVLPEFADCDLFHALLQRGCFLGQGAVLARAAVYRNTGGYDTRLVRAQDFDMALRLSRCCEAARVKQAIFIARRHDGLRGSEVDSFAAERADLKWRGYDKIILRRVRSELAFAEYLPHAERAIELTALLKRRALLYRAAAMARVGLFPEMVEDLQMAFQLDSGTPLTTSEQRILQLQPIWFLDEEGFWEKKFIATLRQSLQGVAGRQMQLTIAQSLYWHARYCLQAQRYAKGMQSFSAALDLMRLGGMAGALRYKLEHRKSLGSCRPSAARD